MVLAVSRRGMVRHERFWQMLTKNLYCSCVLLTFLIMFILLKHRSHLAVLGDNVSIKCTVILILLICSESWLLSIFWYPSLTSLKLILGLVIYNFNSIHSSLLTLFRHLLSSCFGNGIEGVLIRHLYSSATRLYCQASHWSWLNMLKRECGSPPMCLINLSSIINSVDVRTLFLTSLITSSASRRSSFYLSYVEAFELWSLFICMIYSIFFPLLVFILTNFCVK
jgi:hypothetical protein